MNVSLYQAAAAMTAAARWQELISENLAASSVPGFRKQDVSFSAVEAGLNPATVTGFNGSRFVIPAAAAATNFRPGELRPTGNSMDLALEGSGFFEVQMPNGNRAYTRDGEFHLNAQDQLVTKQGYLVLGDGGPVQFDPNSSSPITISSTGEVSQGSELKGRLNLVEFNQPQLLNAAGEGYFLASNPAAQRHPATGTSIRQGFLEASNSSPTAQMANLITSLRLFEANQKVLQTQDDRMNRLIGGLGNPS